MDELVRRRLTKLRTDRRFTQAQIGAAVGWTQTSVSKFELGDFSADLDTLVKFAAFYDMPFADLLSPEGPTRHPDPKAQALRDACERLTAEQRDALLVMLGAATSSRARTSGPARRSVKQGRTPMRPLRA